MSYIKNKKIGFDYEVLEKIEAGISLFGFEVKAIMAGKISLEGAWCGFENNELLLKNMLITPLQPKNARESEERRDRKLLLKKGEIIRLKNLTEKRPLTVVPVSLYNKRGKIKVEIALARGKRKYDKRQKIKKRDAEREIGRRLKG